MFCCVYDYSGAMDPFQIYVWALQTGRLVDVLSGHEGPVACLDFSSTGSMLASGSWDGTLKIWDVYKNTCVDTFEHGCDVLSVSFRPDSKAICSCSTNGLYSSSSLSCRVVGFIRALLQARFMSGTSSQALRSAL